MHHELNEVLGIEFPLPCTELQSYGHTTCSTRHQNTVTAITFCANDVVTSDPGHPRPPTAPHRTANIDVLIQT